METIIIDILNPKAKSIINDLADLNLIRIKKSKNDQVLKDLLNKLRSASEDVLTLDEITAEVESVRKSRYEK